MTLLFTVTVVAAIVAVFIGIERATSAPPTRLEERLLRYGARRMVASEDESEELRPASSSMVTGAVNRAIQGRTFAQELQGDLARADLKLTAGEFIVIQAICALVPGIAGGLLLQNPAAFFILGGVGYYAPRFWMKRRQSKRLSAFNSQLPDTMSLIANTLRSGMSLLQAMEMVSREAAPPTGLEYARVVREVGLGISPQDALIHLVRRIKSDDLELMVTAILVQHEVGGNLARILDSIAHTIRERIKLKGEIKTLTSQQRLTGYLLSGLPVIVAGMLTLINPAYLKAFVEPMGPWTLLPFVATMGIIVGGFIMRRICDIEV